TPRPLHLLERLSRPNSCPPPRTGRKPARRGVMTIRDADRFKDKVEVSLDSRQIFFLFFGGAVVTCLVFVLGVMVGKRLEGREQLARRAGTSAPIVPLAALDELSADEAAKDDLAFPAALAGDEKTR